MGTSEKNDTRKRRMQMTASEAVHLQAAITLSDTYVDRTLVTTLREWNSRCGLRIRLVAL